MRSTRLGYKVVRRVTCAGRAWLTSATPAAFAVTYTPGQWANRPVAAGPLAVFDTYALARRFLLTELLPGSSPIRDEFQLYEAEYEVAGDTPDGLYWPWGAHHRAQDTLPPGTVMADRVRLTERKPWMTPFPETAAQTATLDRLAREGWKVDTTDDDTVYLSKRGRMRGQTLYTQVGPDGTASHEQEGR